MLPISNKSNYGTYAVITAVAYCSLMLLVTGILAYHRVDVFASGALGRMNAISMMTAGGGILIVGLAILLVKVNCVNESEHKGGYYLTPYKIQATRSTQSRSQASRSTGTLGNERVKTYYYQTPLKKDIPVLVLTVNQVNFLKEKLENVGQEINTFAYLKKEECEGISDLNVLIERFEICKPRENASRDRGFTTMYKGPQNKLENETRAEAIMNHRFLSFEDMRNYCTRAERQQYFPPPAGRKSGGGTLKPPASERKDEAQVEKSSEAKAIPPVVTSPPVMEVAPAAVKPAVSEPPPPVISVVAEPSSMEGVQAAPVQGEAAAAIPDAPRQSVVGAPEAPPL